MAWKKIVTSVRNALFGKPVSYEEHRAAQQSIRSDAMVVQHQATRQMQAGGSFF